MDPDPDQKPLFPDIPAIPVRGKHYIQPRGYAAMPGTGPAGSTCGNCQYAQRFRRWIKCTLVARKWTGGRATDILARSPGCRNWEAAR